MTAERQSLLAFWARGKAAQRAIHVFFIFVVVAKTFFFLCMETIAQANIVETTNVYDVLLAGRAE